jgi:hypothetical protein
MMLVIGEHQPEFVREKTSLTPPSRNHFHQAGSLSFCTVGCHHIRSSHPLALRRWGPPLGSGGLNLNTFEGPKIHQNPFDLDASQKRKHDSQRDLATDFKKRPPASSYLRRAVFADEADPYNWSINL